MCSTIQYYEEGETLLRYRRARIDALAPLLVVDDMGYITCLVLRALKDTTIPGRGTGAAPTGLVLVPPADTYIRLSNSSHMPVHLQVGAGVIDEDYRGKITVILHNSSETPFLVQRGLPIATATVISNPRPRVQLTTVKTSEEDQPTSSIAERASATSAAVDIRATSDITLTPLTLTLVNFGLGATVLPDENAVKFAPKPGTVVRPGKCCDELDTEEDGKEDEAKKPGDSGDQRGSGGVLLRYAARPALAVRRGVHVVNNVVEPPVENVVMNMINYSGDTVMMKLGDRVAQIVTEGEEVSIDRVEEIHAENGILDDEQE